MTASLIEHFSALNDPRVERNKAHALIDIIMLTVSAVASGANGWEAIEDFGKEKLDWLRQFVPLKNGVPSHDCIAYVVRGHWKRKIRKRRHPSNEPAQIRQTATPFLHKLSNQFLLCLTQPLSFLHSIN